eukprot:gene4265-4315_t
MTGLLARRWRGFSSAWEPSTVRRVIAGSAEMVEEPNMDRAAGSGAGLEADRLGREGAQEGPGLGSAGHRQLHTHATPPLPEDTH